MNHDSYLIQRLTKPFEFDTAAASPFSFGGGYRNGGLSDEAMELLRGVFRFDYMGSAEFEFGAVPKTLQRIARAAEKDELVCQTIQIDSKHDQHTLWVIAPEEWIPEIQERVQSWLLPWGDRPRMKEQPRLDDTLEWVHDGDPDKEHWFPFGWLELDNGWFAFADRDMADKVVTLFGVEMPEGSIK